jgi:hypothetical protein
MWEPRHQKTYDPPRPITGIALSFSLYTEKCTRNLLEAKGWPVRKADSLIVICETIVYKMLEPRCLNAVGLYGLLQE